MRNAVEGNSPPDNAGVKFPPPFIYLGILVAGLVLDDIFGLPGLGTGALVRDVIAAVLITAGFVIGISAILSFRAAQTNVPPWMPATAIVTSGVFRFTRNPMYLGMALIYAGIAIAANSLLTLLLLIPLLVIIRYEVIAKEERYMERKFGDVYRQYKAHVRRWI